jgi:hypothetical protein
MFSNNGELTCYWFGQGTSKGSSSECTTYKTACGYCGTEAGSATTGCPTNVTDNLPNVANGGYFAALDTSVFGQGAVCGMCVEVSFGGKSLVATVVDECATCNGVTGHVDLSLPAALALGLSTANGDPKSGVTWKAVDCAVTGNIVGVFNGLYAGQIYFQNVVFPVAKAVAGGHTATQRFGFWDFGTAVGGQSVTLTDTLGHVVMGTLPTSSGGSVGTQFPMTCP